MITPALGLDGRCPTDLVRNADGLTKVRLFLQRIEYGVYT
ncbi:antitoxin Xre/MbcA/ParS toxin-binding domain-containing protein [Sphingosinicella sp. BN140058]